MDKDAKEYWIVMLIAIVAVFLWNIIFPDNTKTEIHCSGQECEFKEFAQDGKLISTTTRDAHLCTSFEVHDQPHFSLLSRHGREYSVTCNLKDGGQIVLFKHHIRKYRKAQETADALNNAIQLKEVYLNHTYSNK